MNRATVGFWLGALALSGCVAEGGGYDGELVEDEALSAEQQELRTPGRPSTTLCIAFDEPDDDFIDSNCDGIDGDVDNAVFVAQTGSDTNPGTRAAPMQTLQEAVREAWREGKDVYVAGGIYILDEVLSVLSGVSIYGGYDSNWNRSAGLVGRAIVFRPGTSSHGPAELIAINGLTVSEPTVVDRLFIRVGSNAAGSSIGINVFDSPMLSLRNLDVGSGFAGHGADGAAGNNGGRASRGSSGMNGFSATCGPNTIPAGNGGLSCHFACDRDCVTIRSGGQGGTKGRGHDGLTSQVGANAFGVGGLGGRMNRPGRPGGDAPPMSTIVRHNPVNGLGGGPSEAGATGPSGRRGGGGGGGGSGGASWLGYWGGTGGGGGGGGCGGLGGEGGGPGAHSIGLKVRVAIGLVEQNVFRANTAGNGGDGGAGQPGGFGGFGGAGGGSGGDCGSGAGGGRGANGEDGGVGGGGGGGNSVAVWLVEEPHFSDHSFDPSDIWNFGNTLVAGNAGRGGHGASVRAPSDVGELDGADGLSQPLLIQCEGPAAACEDE